MIDLADALAPLVERAPTPPAVESVARRGRRHRRRRAGALVGTLALVALVAGSAISVASRGGKARVATPPPKVEHVRVTLLDGSQLDISAPVSLGLSELPMSFNAQLTLAAYKGAGPVPGHSFTIVRTLPEVRGAATASHLTSDGHTLTVYSDTDGADAVIQYAGWALVVDWNDEPTDWASFASALDAHITPDGFLVIESSSPGWLVGPTDGPDVRIGDYAFFGPTHERCRDAAPVAGERCNADATVMTRALEPTLDDTVDDIEVSYARPDRARATVTSLEGSRYEITAPSSVLDLVALQATVAVDGLATTNPIVVQARREPTATEFGGMGSAVATADGEQMFVVGFPGGDVALEAYYGNWVVDVIVTGVPDTDRTRIASRFAAHEDPDGFLVLDPRPSMRVVTGSAAGILLDGISIVTSSSEPWVVQKRPDVSVRRVG